MEHLNRPESVHLIGIDSRATIANIIGDMHLLDGHLGFQLQYLAEAIESAEVTEQDADILLEDFERMRDDMEALLAHMSSTRNGIE